MPRVNSIRATIAMTNVATKAQHFWDTAEFWRIIALAQMRFNEPSV